MKDSTANKRSGTQPCSEWRSALSIPLTFVCSFALNTRLTLRKAECYQFQNFDRKRQRTGQWRVLLPVGGLATLLSRRMRKLIVLVTYERILVIMFTLMSYWSLSIGPRWQKCTGTFVIRLILNTSAEYAESLSRTTPNHACFLFTMLFTVWRPFRIAKCASYFFVTK
jgi:hypothetical protein